MENDLTKSDLEFIYYYCNKMRIKDSEDKDFRDLVLQLVKDTINEK